MAKLFCAFAIFKGIFKTVNEQALVANNACINWDCWQPAWSLYYCIILLKILYQIYHCSLYLYLLWVLGHQSITHVHPHVEATMTSSHHLQPNPTASNARQWPFAPIYTFYPVKTTYKAFTNQKWWPALDTVPRCQVTIHHGQSCSRRQLDLRNNSCSIAFFPFMCHSLCSRKLRIVLNRPGIGMNIWWIMLRRSCEMCFLCSI